MNLNYRQKLILDTCLKQDEPVSIKSLMKLLQIKEKTLRKEIQSLNLLIQDYDAKLVLRKRQGYLLQASAALRTSLLQLIGPLPQPSSLHHMAEQKRVLQIMEWMIEHDETKIEDLERHLNLHRSSFVKEMKRVRQLFCQFHIQVQTRPYYGMHLIAEETDIRLVLYHLRQFSNKRQDPHIIDIIMKNKLSLKDSGFIHLTELLQISKQRYQHQHACRINEEQIHLLRPLPCFQAAQEMVDYCQDEHETAWVASLILSGLDVLEEMVYHYPISFIMQVSEIQKTVLEALQKEGLAMDEDETFANALMKTLIPIVVRSEFHITISDYSTDIDRMILQSPFAVFAAIKIQTILQQLGLQIQHAEILQLAILVYNTIIPRHYHFRPLRIAIVSTLGIQGAASLKYRILNRYEHYIESIETLHSYELDQSDMSQFDLLLYYDRDALDLSRVSIATVAISYFIDWNDYSELFEKMIVPRFILTSPFVCNQLQVIPSNAPDKEALIEQIQSLFQMELPLLCIHDKTAVICVSATQPQASICIRLNNEIWVEGQKLQQCFLFPIHCHNDLLQMKMAEHVSRLVLFNQKAQQFLFDHAEHIPYSELIHQRTHWL